MEKFELDLESETIEVTEEELEEAEDYVESLDEDIEAESESVDFSSVEEEDVNDETVLEVSNVSDPIRMYLRDIGKINLLTSEEEYDLSEDVLKGREAQKKLDEIDADDLNNVSIEDYKALQDIVDKAEISRDKLANGNLRLVVAIAKHYIGRGLQFDDLIQEGNMGLLKAIEKYDCTKGFKFSTYATWWIRQSITRAIADQSRTIRIPVHMVETINLMNRIEREMMTEYGRKPTLKELSEKIGLPEEKITRIKAISQPLVSLEKPVGEEEDSTLSDFIADESQLTPYQYTERKELNRELNALLDNVLSEKEKKVIEMRFGMNGNDQMTLEEVAATFQPRITRERVRQIEAKALRRLQRNQRAKELKAFLRK